MLSKVLLKTPLGGMLALGDEELIYALEFVDAESTSCIDPGSEEGIPSLHWTPPLALLQQELNLYFEGGLFSFTTKFFLRGSLFQERVWHSLLNIPYGTTQSYRDQSCGLGCPTSYRAVANANAVNPLPIVIPCHRVIKHDGTMGGYAGQLWRKKWLLNHESRHRSCF